MPGLTPADRAALIAWAKARAIPVHSCVAASLRPDHLLGEASREELAALVVVLAEAADLVKLRAVAASDDGVRRLDRAGHETRLRKAHSEATALRRAGQEVPVSLLVLERQYVRARQRERAAARREGRAA